MLRKSLLPLLLAASTAALHAEPAAVDADQRLTDDARKATKQLLLQLSGELKREFELSGAMRSIIVCKYVGPEASSAMSRRLGVQMRRVSLRVRNPALGMPDAWEQKVLLDFDRRLAQGENPAQMDYAETVKEPNGTYFRYMKAIPVTELCLNCHGQKPLLSTATRAQLAQEYPHDQATGYAVGQIRGAVTYKKPL